MRIKYKPWVANETDPDSCVKSGIRVKHFVYSFFNEIFSKTTSMVPQLDYFQLRRLVVKISRQFSKNSILDDRKFPRRLPRKNLFEATNSASDAAAQRVIKLWPSRDDVINVKGVVTGTITGRLIELSITLSSSLPEQHARIQRRHGNNSGGNYADASSNWCIGRHQSAVTSNDRHASRRQPRDVAVSRGNTAVSAVPPSSPIMHHRSVTKQGAFDKNAARSCGLKDVVSTGNRTAYVSGSRTARRHESPNQSDVSDGCESSVELLNTWMKSGLFSSAEVDMLTKALMHRMLDKLKSGSVGAAKPTVARNRFEWLCYDLLAQKRMRVTKNGTDRAHVLRTAIAHRILSKFADQK